MSQSDFALSAGEVVQLKPGAVRNEAFAACFMVVTEVKTWGAQGYVTCPGAGQAYYRAQWEEMTRPLGFAEFVTE